MPKLFISYNRHSASIAENLVKDIESLGHAVWFDQELSGGQVAANVMRRVLVDHARRHTASQRGDGVRCVSLDAAADLPAANEMSILALDHALQRLETLDAGLAKVVELRAFGRLTIEEAAHVLDVSPSTAKRDWRTAKAWLNRELGSESRS